MDDIAKELVEQQIDLDIGEDVDVPIIEELVIGWVRYAQGRGLGPAVLDERLPDYIRLGVFWK
jgi:hypothetical protein